MPRTLYDDAGKAVEVPDENELAALKTAEQEAQKLKDDIKALEDKSPEGVRSLRQALGRKEEQIRTMEAQLKELGHQQASPALGKDEIVATATTAATQVLIDAEIAKVTAGMKEEDAKTFKTKLEKLTAGEKVTLETLPVFVTEAQRAAGLAVERRSPPPRTGRGPHQEEGEKKFGETDEGKAFAQRLGLPIEVPKKKE